MNKYIKILTLIISLLVSNASFGQSENQIAFYGYQLSKYDKPVMVRQNEYKPYYRLIEKREQGRIILDAETKTFSVKWRSGESWSAKIIKKEQKSVTQEMLGRVLKTTYSGIWLDDNVRCELVTMETYEGKCVIILKTGKVVDEYYNIDDWKNIFNFTTGNECLNEIEINEDNKQEQVKKNTSNSTDSPVLFRGRNKSTSSTDLNKSSGKSDLRDEFEKEKNIATEKRKANLLNEKEIKSKIYDLEKYAPDKYLSSYNIQRDEIIKYFIKESNYSTEKFPSFKSIINSKVPFQRFRNTYDIKYSLKDNSRESVIRNGIVSAGTRDIRTLKEIELISGNDSELSLFKYASISIPTIKIEGYEVMTEVIFKNVLVDFTRGITEVKIKKNEVEFKKHPPEKDFQEIVTNELKAKGVNGKFLVKYEIQDIMGQSTISIQLEKK